MNSKYEENVYTFTVFLRQALVMQPRLALNSQYFFLSLSTQTPDVRYHAWSDFTNFLKVVSKKLFQRKAESLPVQWTFKNLFFRDSIFFITQKELVCHYHKSHLKSTTITVFGILDWVCHESCNLSDTTFLRGTMIFKKTKPGLTEMLKILILNVNYIISKMLAIIYL